MERLMNMLKNILLVDVMLMLCVATSNAQMEMIEDISQNKTSDSVKQSGCHMNCGQIERFVETEWTAQFSKHHTEIKSIAKQVSQNITRAHGRCKQKGPWCYHDGEVDRCKCCSGDCPRGDLSCAAFCQGYLADRKQRKNTGDLKVELEEMDKNHKDETNSLRSFCNVLIACVVLLTVSLLGLFLWVVYVMRQFENKLSEQKTHHPKSDVENPLMKGQAAPDPDSCT